MEKRVQERGRQAKNEMEGRNGKKGGDTLALGNFQKGKMENDQ